jgi:hypothetical protein
MQRYFFSQDNSSHWYLVPADKRSEWSLWCGLDEDDERAWDAPKWAQRIDGAVQWWTFEAPKDARP